LVKLYKTKEKQHKYKPFLKGMSKNEGKTSNQINKKMGSTFTN
jgi:hypothetical protein